MQSKNASTSFPCKWDAIFLVCAAIYAYLAFRGIIPISAAGASMDSDLMTYAQGMAGEARPCLFHADPVLHSESAANSIHNIERMLATWLAPSGEWAFGLLLAGSCCIFVFYAAWYCFGRWLMGSPALAAMLALASGITVWTGWGTFWGIAHSDPLPRVFFGALMPLLLWLATPGLRKPFLRPIAMAMAGLLILAHGVSALNCGAMLFMAFCLIRQPGQSPKAHILNLVCCLAAFLTPVLIFLWPSLFQAQKFAPEDLAMFQEVMALRWHADFGSFAGRMREFFSPFGMVFPVLAGGLAGWLAAMFKGSRRERDFCRMCPCFILALLLVSVFCWLETTYACKLGRVPMGHELVRGMRLLIPVAWVCIICGIGCLFGVWGRRIILGMALGLTLVFTVDRQYMAAQYAVTLLAGLPTPLAAEAENEKRQAEKLRDLMEAVKNTVPEGEAIYSPEELMQVRYISLRPLAHSFKDGYVHFYNKDAAAARKWLRLEKLKKSERHGWLKAWEASEAPWLLIKATNADNAVPDDAIVLRKNGWILAKHE